MNNVLLLLFFLYNYQPVFWANQEYKIEISTEKMFDFCVGNYNESTLVF